MVCRWLEIKSVFCILIVNDSGDSQMYKYIFTKHKDVNVLEIKERE